MSFVYIRNVLFCIIIGSSFASSEKYCVNCKFFVKNPFCHDTFGKCSAFRKNIENHQLLDYLVSGKQKIEYKYCSTARENENLCGKEGKMYIEKSNFIKDFVQPLLSNKNNINIY